MYKLLITPICYNILIKMFTAIILSAALISCEEKIDTSSTTTAADDPNLATTSDLTTITRELVLQQLDAEVQKINFPNGIQDRESAEAILPAISIERITAGSKYGENADGYTTSTVPRDVRFTPENLSKIFPKYIYAYSETSKLVMCESVENCQETPLPYIGYKFFNDTDLTYNPFTESGIELLPAAMNSSSFTIAPLHSLDDVSIEFSLTTSHQDIKLIMLYGYQGIEIEFNKDPDQPYNYVSGYYFNAGNGYSISDSQKLITSDDEDMIVANNPHTVAVRMCNLQAHKNNAKYTLHTASTTEITIDDNQSINLTNGILTNEMGAPTLVNVLPNPIHTVNLTFILDITDGVTDKDPGDDTSVIINNIKLTATDCTA